ncbi:hypothetical protein KIK06_23765 [Nocardiopsis sp. EMB25]|uniref:hypothetical protein n=1 Tax=Nocardiopsis sp. EMB25 TaxID=2835867 RepID=UPI002283B238|nr:hypothetical protein [Nocardiopsis sp. EMB25]MCY9786905.1 hypothetical protein [Nocardiopsis sp. EMB25]
MRYLRTLWRALFEPPRGRHAHRSKNVQPAAPDGGRPIPHPRPPALQVEPVDPASTPLPVAPVPMDDPHLARPYLLAVERRRVGQPAVPEEYDLLAPDPVRPEPPSEAPPVDLEELATAVRTWRALTGVSA